MIRRLVTTLCAVLALAAAPLAHAADANQAGAAELEAVKGIGPATVEKNRDRIQVGGAAVVEYFELQHWTSSFFGLVAMFGLVFVCGLPGWAMVRWTFNSIRKREGETVEDILRDLRNGGKHDA